MTRERSPCYGCSYKDYTKKLGHCERCKEPEKWADSIYSESAICAIDYTKPVLVVAGGGVYSGSLLKIYDGGTI